MFQGVVMTRGDKGKFPLLELIKVYLKEHESITNYEIQWPDGQTSPSDFTLTCPQLNGTNSKPTEIQNDSKE
jgi:hypothetical protein